MEFSIYNFQCDCGKQWTILVDASDTCPACGKIPSTITSGSSSGKIEDDLRQLLGYISNPAMQSSRWKLSARYKIISEKIQRNEKPSKEEVKSYFKEPVEFEAYGAVFALNIRNKMETLTTNQRKILIKQLERWLRRGGELPSSIYINRVILSAWRSKPTLWRSFRIKLFNLVQSLK